MVEAYTAVIARLTPDEDEQTRFALVEALTALAHGYAAFLLEGLFGAPPQAVEHAAERVAEATLALAQRRDALFGPTAG